MSWKYVEIEFMFRKQTFFTISKRLVILKINFFSQTLRILFSMKLFFMDLFEQLSSKNLVFVISTFFFYL